MARRSGLGRGLGALIPNEVLQDQISALFDLPISSIRPNPRQPRAYFAEEALASLTESIKELGVLQPLLVRPLEDAQYEIIAGERRWRAAKRAGLQTIPALVRHVPDVQSLEQALVENLHREDLGPLEEAAAFQQLLEDFGVTQEQLSLRVGKSRAAISNSIRLFQLPASVQKLLSDGQLSAGHARALLATPDRAYQEALARRVVKEGLSVRATEEAVRFRTNNPPTQADPPGEPTLRLRPPGVLELEQLLADHLDTRVKVDLGPKRGRMVIDFASLEDLERIYRAMTLDGHENS